MSNCQKCGDATMYDAAFCKKCRAEYDEFMRTKGVPKPITTAPFSIFDWAELERVKRRELRKGRSVSDVRVTVYKWAENRQKKYDICQNAIAIEEQREARIAKMADQV